MRFFKYSYLLLAGLVVWSGCIKTSTLQAKASLNIVNAISSSNPLIPDFNPPGNHGQNAASLLSFASGLQIPFGGSAEVGSYVGATSISLRQLTDTAAIVWSGMLSLAPAGVYTLFLCGDTASADTLFTFDVLPKYAGSDSSASLRIVDLMQGGPSIEINLQGNNPSIPEFTGLAYKSVSGFKPYSANSSSPGFYNFEIRDQSTGSLLGTVTWFYTYQRSNTVLICGSVSGDLNSFQVNNF